MSDQEDHHLDRLQTIMTSLLKRRISESLSDVEAALKRWRDESLGEFEAHAEVLRHAARTERLAARMARVGFDSAGSLMRDAFDLGIITSEEFTELMECDPSEVEPSPAFDELEDGEPEELPDKQQVVHKLLEAGAILMHVDARGANVSVPERFAVESQLVLRFGYNLTPAIPDLMVDDDGVAGTLRFGGIPHHCVLPWSSVYAVRSEVDRRGLVWPDDVPDTVVKELAGMQVDDPGIIDKAPDKEPDPPRGRHLRLVK